MINFPAELNPDCIKNMYEIKFTSMKSLSLLICFLSSLITLGQDLTLVTSLDNLVEETSGLLFVDNRVITHNDSGGEASLYEINITNGNVSRTVAIKGATNTDWEDICNDENYIYIGDFGNNSGNRTNLRIYKILKADYLNSTEVVPEVINFSYADQTDFTAAPQATDFDAEALISYGNDLFVFTKNWVNKQTNIYKISKAPGTYEVAKVDNFDPQGLITGGSYNPLSGKVVLTGYSGITAFLVELTGFSNGKFSNGLIDKYDVTPPTLRSFQIEGVTYFNQNDYYLSAEKNVLGSASLYSISSKTLGVDMVELNRDNIFPNPVGDFLTIDVEVELEKTEIFDYLGKKVLDDHSGKKTLGVQHLNQGVYVLKLYYQGGSSSLKFIKE
jgi:hypothetical protein